MIEKYGVEDVKQAQGAELEKVEKKITFYEKTADPQEKTASEEISRLRERKKELEEAIKSK